MRSTTLRTRVLVWWLLVVSLCASLVTLELIGPTVALVTIAILFSAQAYIFLSTTCPNCRCFILGRLSKEDLFAPPFWVPERCPRCDHDLTNYPAKTRND